MGEKSLEEIKKLVSKIAEISKGKIPNMRSLADVYRLVEKQLKRQGIC
ncbi:MAG: hypothetical protein J7K17_04200 [Candidatus Omnitrophica bacterium]|nr:hypothetical protein [Candidatus Omnitrophota bacterium]